MKTNGNEPACSIVETCAVEGHATIECTSQGLTKREYFAAMAMQGLLSNNYGEKLNELSEWMGVTPQQAVVTMAVELADALIEALNKEW